MKCERCKGDGRMIGGDLVDGAGKVIGKATGWGQCDSCKGTGQRTIVVVEPPDLETVIAAGYGSEVAAAIVAREQAKAGRGEKPYGPNDPSLEEWGGTPTPIAIPDAPAPPAAMAAAPPASVFEYGQSVALISGGPIMKITALLGDEVACEWPILGEDAKPTGGVNSRAFAVSSLKPVV